jgi:hypothetical protein
MNPTAEYGKLNPPELSARSYSHFPPYPARPLENST